VIIGVLSSVPFYLFILARVVNYKQLLILDIDFVRCGRCGYALGIPPTIAIKSRHVSRSQILLGRAEFVWSAAAILSLVLPMILFASRTLLTLPDETTTPTPPALRTFHTIQTCSTTLLDVSICDVLPNTNTQTLRLQMFCGAKVDATEYICVAHLAYASNAYWSTGPQRIFIEGGDYLPETFPLQKAIVII
jgi:hypothetical protein